MTPTPEHIERLALADFVIPRNSIQCSFCSSVITGTLGDTAGGLVNDAGRLGWCLEMVHDAQEVACPDCAADATEEQA